MEPETFEKIRFCACANLRRTTRQVTQIYDDALQETGLRSGQFALLATLAIIGPSSMTELAEALGMDRTTLTRNLQALRRDRLVEDQANRDGRRRQVGLTELGSAMLNTALPYWEQAQARIVTALGSDQFEGLLGTLKALRRGIR